MDALDRGLGVLPPSALYALAAIETGCAFVDFTPSVGARLPAIEALAEAHEVPLAGSDGKTGETFMKSVLAPALAARALKVRSWAGMNLLGGGDGAALADPARAQSKLDSKGRLLEEILGYPVEAPIHIEDVRDMGEWKTAWDHIVFEGFLGVRMKLQFTWEGCDSALAAPLLLDLMRLMALALERGERGVLAEPRVLLQGPGRHARARAAPPVRDARALGAPEGRRVSLPARGGPGRAGPPAGGVVVSRATCWSVPRRPARCGDVSRTAGLVASSSCLYLAGMALNDYADRDVDAVERPGRPIPSGRVSPEFALGLAGALTAGAGAARGRRRRAARAGRRRCRWPPRSGATTWR